jgi:hypothetical protein
MKYTNSNQWYQEYGFKIMSDYEFMDFEKYLDDIRQNGSHTLDEWEDLYDDFLKEENKKLYFYDDIPATNSIRISNSEIAELDLMAKIEESDLNKYLKKYLKKDTNVWFYHDLSKLAKTYDCKYEVTDELKMLNEQIIMTIGNVFKDIESIQKDKENISKTMSAFLIKLSLIIKKN